MKVRKFYLLGAVAALVALIGVASFDSRPASAQGTATKVCTQPAPGATTFNCRLTYTGVATASTTLTITITGNATFASATVDPTSTCLGVLPVPTVTVAAGGASISLPVDADGCLAAETIILNETLNVTGTAGVPSLSQALTGAATATATATDLLGAPFVITAPATTRIASFTCAPANLSPGSSPVPAQTGRPSVPSGTPINPDIAAEGGIAAVAVSLCAIDFDDNGATPTTVSSGEVRLEIVGGTAANAVGLVSFDGPDITPINTLRINCPPPSFGTRTSAADSCNTVQFFVLLRAGVSPTIGPFGNVVIRVQYDPDVDAVNTGLTQDVAGPNVIQPTGAGFRQPGMRVVCTTLTPFPAVQSPGELPLPRLLDDLGGSAQPIAIGELPGGIPCRIDADANLATSVVEPSAPGTFEISALSGGLLDASGRFSTNLRIGCGDTPSLSSGILNFNTCVGVRFTVFGAGVSLVEVRVRYEPSALAQAAGILEDEGAFTVGFIAPAATVNLALSPNPVTVGATGTATARFNRSSFCAAGVVCIDPTTGLPIAVTTGTLLNGNVTFTIDNSAIASWVNPQTATTTPVSSTGFITSANQTTVRCGFFPTTSAPTQFALGSFFGGCLEVTASYRGNVPGVTNVAATFQPDLPAASALPFLSGIPSPTITSVRALEVVGAAPVGDVQLARGCNNVSPTVTETAAAYAARVNPTSALVAIWEHQAATNTFRGYSPQAGAPNDLPGVTRLRPVFVCTSGAATLNQPAA